MFKSVQHHFTWRERCAVLFKGRSQRVTDALTALTQEKHELQRELRQTQDARDGMQAKYDAEVTAHKTTQRELESVHTLRQAAVTAHETTQRALEDAHTLRQTACEFADTLQREVGRLMAELTTAQEAAPPPVRKRKRRK